MVIKKIGLYTFNDLESGKTMTGAGFWGDAMTEDRICDYGKNCTAMTTLDFTVAGPLEYISDPDAWLRSTFREITNAEMESYFEVLWKGTE